MRRRSDLLRFEIGGSRVLRSSDDDEVTLVAAGITLHEALAAADELAEEGVAALVIDLYSIKPIDAQALVEAAEAAGTSSPFAQSVRGRCGFLAEAMSRTWTKLTLHD
jgi:transketolase C-terminal domain/subunit